MIRCALEMKFFLLLVLYHVSSHILSDSLFPYFLCQHSPLPPLPSPLPQTSPSPSSISQPWQYSLKIKTPSYCHYCPDSDSSSTQQWRFRRWRFQEDNRYTCAPTRSDSILHQIESEKHSFPMLKLSCSGSCPIGLLFFNRWKSAKRIKLSAAEKSLSNAC